MSLFVKQIPLFMSLVTHNWASLSLSDWYGTSAGHSAAPSQRTITRSSYKAHTRIPRSIKQATGRRGSTARYSTTSKPVSGKFLNTYDIRTPYYFVIRPSICCRWAPAKSSSHSLFIAAVTGAAFSKDISTIPRNQLLISRLNDPRRASRKYPVYTLPPPSTELIIKRSRHSAHSWLCQICHQLNVTQSLTHRVVVFATFCSHLFSSLQDTSNRRFS